MHGVRVPQAGQSRNLLRKKNRGTDCAAPLLELTGIP
jgi:hypothetical protein